MTWEGGVSSTAREGLACSIIKKAHGASGTYPSYQATSCVGLAGNVGTYVHPYYAVCMYVQSNQAAKSSQVRISRGGGKIPVFGELESIHPSNGVASQQKNRSMVGNCWHADMDTATATATATVRGRAPEENRCIICRHPAA